MLRAFGLTSILVVWVQIVQSIYSGLFLKTVQVKWILISFLGDGLTNLVYFNDNTFSYEKPKKFTSMDFKQWLQKIFFYLTMLNLAKYLSEVCPVINPNEQDVMMLETLEAWKHEDFLCWDYILNCLVNSLYNVYGNIKSIKQSWESL